MCVGCPDGVFARAHYGGSSPSDGYSLRFRQRSRNRRHREGTQTLHLTRSLAVCIRVKVGRFGATCSSATVTSHYSIEKHTNFTVPRSTFAGVGGRKAIFCSRNAWVSRQSAQLLA